MNEGFPKIIDEAVIDEVEKSRSLGSFHVDELPECELASDKWNRDNEARNKKNRRNEYSANHLSRGTFKHLDSPAEWHKASFGNSFRELIPTDTDFVAYIEGELRNRNGEALGIEFGGMGNELFKGFKKGLFKRTYAVGLLDHRTSYSERTKPDTHQFILGDIFDRKTYNELPDEKFDLIIERMLGGMETVPEDYTFVSRLLNRWYRMLNENGMMFVQVPIVFNNLMVKWAQLINTDFKDRIIFKGKVGEYDNEVNNCSTLFIQKKAGAPDDLPLLSVDQASHTVAFRSKSIYE